MPSVRLWLFLQTRKGSKEDEGKGIGLKWDSAGDAQPAQGCKLENAELAAALAGGKTEFTEQEWTAFGVSDLRPKGQASIRPRK
jgi:hypothetical protein